MTRLIDADALRYAIEKRIDNITDEDFAEGMAEAITEIDLQPTIDAVPLDGSFVKMSRGDYLIYNCRWLFEHFDQGIDIQRSAMKSMGYEPVIKGAELVRHGNDLISRQALCEYALNQKDKSITLNEIMRFPSAYPKKGKWVIEDGHVCCSECGEISKEYNYCPYCGARMDEDE